MNDNNKKYLKELREELTQYQKKLGDVQRSFKGEAGKEGGKMYKSLQNILKEAGRAYDNLTAASAQEWEPLKKIANDSFEDLKAAFEDVKNSTTKQVKEYAHQVEEYSQETLDATVEYIKSNPFKSVLIAGSLGFIIGRVLK